MTTPGYISPDDVVDLTWRDEKLSLREIHDKVTRALYLLDRHGELKIQLAETKIKDTVDRRRIEGDSTWVWTRKRKFIRRTGETVGTRRWFAEFFHVGIEILRVMDAQQPSKCRQFQYVTGGPTRRSKDHVKQMVMNWAVTLEVHPFCLGIILASTGEVFIPEGFRIEYTQKQNMLTRVETSGVIRSGRASIPSNIVDLKVVNGKDVNAVVVTEHRNVNTDLGSFVENNKDVIVIMTAGYSCLATREFLRLLIDSRALKNTLFLWISDHDPHAFQVYSSLKYGSAAMAWVAPSTRAKRLEFFGPTESHVEQLIDQEIDALKPEIKARQPSLTDAQVKANATERMREVRERFSIKCRQKLNRNDVAILKNVKKSSQQDRWLDVEVNRMMETERGKFSFCELDNVSRGLGLAFMLQAVKSFQAVEPPTRRFPGRSAWNEDNVIAEEYGRGDTQKDIRAGMDCHAIKGLVEVSSRIDQAKFEEVATILNFSLRQKLALASAVTVDAMDPNFLTVKHEATGD
ncbi:MAG: hypothetical protein Q9185_002671 [Variospora sp. 1 TL-2023]